MNDNLTPAQADLLQEIEASPGPYYPPTGDKQRHSYERLNLAALREGGLVEQLPDMGWFTTDKGSETLVEWRKR